MLVDCAHCSTWFLIGDYCRTSRLEVQILNGPDSAKVLFQSCLAGAVIEAIYKDCGPWSCICAGHFVVMGDTPRPHTWDSECEVQCKHKGAAGHGVESAGLDARTDGCSNRLYKSYSTSDV